MNETLKVLESRRSCRNFKPDMVKEDELKAIIKAGTYAATGMGKQSPIIIAVKDKEMRDRLSEENRKIGGIHRAKEEFESDFGKAILEKLGITDEYEGIGYCALGYAAEAAKDPAPRKENYVYEI